MLKITILALSLLALYFTTRSPADTKMLLEKQAAQETYINNLLLLPEPLQGMHVGYVENGTKPGNGKYYCGPISKHEAERAANIIVTVLDKLPHDFFKKINLKYLLLCSSAKASGRAVGGVAVPPLNLLVVDAAEENGEEFLQRTFFHELYHFLEMRFNTFQDPEWNKLYKKGYFNTYSVGGGGEMGSGMLGFANSYSMTFPHEERAELFSLLLINPSRLSRYISYKSDSLLKEKAIYVINKCEESFGVTF